MPAVAFETELKLDTETPDIKTSLTNASAVLAANREGVTEPQDILAAAQSDYGNMVGTLYDLGFFGPVVSILVDGREASSLSSVATIDSVSRVDLIISSGPAFRFGEIQISPTTPATVIPDAFRNGLPAETAVIRDAALAGIDGWRAVGHAKADVVRQSIIADHQQAELDVALDIEPGPRVRFGDLDIMNASTVRRDRIRAIAGIPSGDVFDPIVLERAAARLRRTGAFSSLSLREVDDLRADETLDVELALVDAKPRRIGFGLEVHSAEGMSLSGFWLHRNLLGGAERFRIEAEISGIGSATNGLDYHLRANLTRPSTFDTDANLYVLGKIEQLDEPLYFSRQAAVEFGVDRFYTEQLSAKAGIAFRYSDIEDDLGARQYTHVAFPVAVTWDRRDNALNPTRGTYLHADIMPFVGIDGASGARGYLDARAYRGVGSQDNFVFAGRFQAGSVVGSSIAETPPDLLFFSGGSGTVRGHGYQSLSITSGLAETGARSFVGGSAEVRMRVTDNIGAVAFYDAGYVGENSWFDDTGGWHSGAGLGLRYQTGIGPIRLDIATPVGGTNSSGLEVYLGIGQAF